MLEKNSFTIILDPGHARDTSGKRSPYSLQRVRPKIYFEEWQFNRDIVFRIKSLLENDGIDVFITTTSDKDGTKDVTLATRAKRANDYIKQFNRRGLFLSIHANAAGNGTQWMNARGWSVWTTKGQNNSDKLADCLYEAAKECFPSVIKIRTETYEDKDNDYEKDFTVIKKANMPAVLTENLFYDNIEDCTYLNTEEGKDTIAKIHYLGIIKYIEQYG